MLLIGGKFCSFIQVQFLFKSMVITFGLSHLGARFLELYDIF